MQWTPEQYLRRVLVEVAQGTGRGVLAVAGEPLAVTLWTWGELRAMAREAEVRRLGDRVDMAAMTAQAFHDPKALKQQETRYLRQAGLLKPMLDAAKARALATVARSKSAKVTRVARPR